jgi:hypothetical protein
VVSTSSIRAGRAHARCTRDSLRLRARIILAERLVDAPINGLETARIEAA